MRAVRCHGPSRRLAQLRIHEARIRIGLHPRSHTPGILVPAKTQDRRQILRPQSGRLDVLPSGDTQRLESIHVQYLLDFVRRQYRLLCADLSGNMEQYTLDIMQESKRIFLVSTPELPCLLLNRFQSGSMVR